MKKIIYYAATSDMGDYERVTEKHCPSVAGISPDISINAEYLSAACANLHGVSSHEGASLKFETAGNRRTVKIAHTVEPCTPGIADAVVYIATVARPPAKGA